ncbi:MAG: gfo/Idh/MocA family oxidoreductase, partial [Treponema sp.]|nr:gfo/Idh/MocA family oxidoreductase [Treponema sp.]
FEALGNIYRTFIGALMKIKAGKKPGKTELDFPGVDMGVDGVRFINKCVESSGRNAAWVKY